MGDSLPALGADAIDRLQFGSSVLDHDLVFHQPSALDWLPPEISSLNA
jgi:hypothetical protein